MIELPEAINLAKQFNENVVGKKVSAVLPPRKHHTFCWFGGDPADYHAMLSGRTLTGCVSFGMFVELAFSGKVWLCIDDGVNPRLLRADTLPSNYQLAICFEDGDALVFTVVMYGGIVLHDDNYSNEYYRKSREAISPFSDEFDAVFERIVAETKPTLSMKALIATEQRFPGIGNGVAQDILLYAGLNPKRKLSTLSAAERSTLLEGIKTTLRAMTERGGRDTEKDIFGSPGGYLTKMSKNTLYTGCPICGGSVVKEAYLGGSVYYCPNCQPLSGR